MLNSSSSPPYPRNRKRGDSSPSSTLPRRIILVRHGESVGEILRLVIVAESICDDHDG